MKARLPALHRVPDTLSPGFDETKVSQVLWFQRSARFHGKQLGIAYDRLQAPSKIVLQRGGEALHLLAQSGQPERFVCWKLIRHEPDFLESDVRQETLGFCTPKVSQQFISQPHRST